MLTAEARVETERSSRFLAQLCEHVKQVTQSHAEMQANVEWSDDRGLIDFGWGRCTLRADPDALLLRAEASDEGSLQRIMQRVAERLERFGRRDQLAVTWTRGAGVDEPSATPRRTMNRDHSTHDWGRDA